VNPAYGLFNMAFIRNEPYRSAMAVTCWPTSSHLPLYLGFRLARTLSAGVGAIKGAH
jgi:hypothetical protein